MVHMACYPQLMKKATASQLLGQSSPAEHLRIALKQVILNILTRFVEQYLVLCRLTPIDVF